MMSATASISATGASGGWSGSALAKARLASDVARENDRLDVRPRSG
jgi:hypothetical protein